MRERNFLKSVVTLLSGSAFGQILMVLALPLLTRLYTPDDFGALAVFSALLVILSVLSTLRLEIAIAVAKTEQEANILTVLALSFSVLCGLLTAAVLYTPIIYSLIEIKLPRLIAYLWLIPIGVFLTGSYNTLQYWMNRHKEFLYISRTRITQSVMAVSVQVSFGFYGLTPLGLLLGYIFSVGGGAFFLLKKILQTHSTSRWCSSFREIKNVLYTYRKYPQYATLESLANNAAIQLPLIIIAFYAVSAEAGYLLLAMRVMQAPLTMLGSAIAQVYISHAKDEHHKGNLQNFTIEVATNLFKFGVGPLIFIGSTAPLLFPLLFGETWTRAGTLVCWMTPWFVFQFISSPISMSLHILEHQLLALCLQLFGFFLRVGSLFIAITYFNNYLSEIYIISGWIFYFTYIYIIFYVLDVKLYHFFDMIKKSYKYMLPWIFGVFFIQIIFFVFGDKIKDYIKNLFLFFKIL